MPPVSADAGVDATPTRPTRMRPSRTQPTRLRPNRMRIVRTRRDYNRWVANETLEDYALRFTARRARVWSRLRVANTALGSISFLALEAIGGTLTLSFGFANVAVAITAVCLLIGLLGIPVCVAAARGGLDIDLLTRGAGFGYIGSTLTSLIYATFTFLFFGIEAAILAGMLNRFLLVPLWLAYILCALVVIPFVTHGITFIGRLQLVSQPVWLALNAAPLIGVLLVHPGWIAAWRHWQMPGHVPGTPALDLRAIGSAASIMIVLISQTAEQVDYIRFMPPPRPDGGRLDTLGWWAAVLVGGPGWIVPDALKLLAGSLLAWAGLKAGLAVADAVQPAEMYRLAWDSILPPLPALAATVLLVCLAQIKINVTNAYAGSLAWSNFFSRLTHSHPGRVFYVLFNVAIALALMEAGILDTIQRGLVLYADLACAWMGAVVAHLVVCRPLGLAPRTIEFKRAHLPDLNPVGVGAMLLGSAAGILAFAGLFGDLAAAFGPFIALALAFTAAPAIALATGGRTYLARRARAGWQGRPAIACSICEHEFEPEDMAYCPAYGGAICSLCCSLDSRCGDACKPHSTRLQAQLAAPLAPVLRRLPPRALAWLGSRMGRFLLLLLFTSAALYGLLDILLPWAQAGAQGTAHGGVGGAPRTERGLLAGIVVAAILCWLVVLSGESRQAAEEETSRQTRLLMDEIAAHGRTDAALQRARDRAEAASLAKSRYVVGISHELRSPLNAILGYAQLMEADPGLPEGRRRMVRIMRESGEHLSAIIAGLLDISRIEAGRIELQHEPVRLPELLEGLVQMLRPTAEAKGLALRYEARGLPALVLADEHRLRQILINLLSNAIKFTDAGEVRLQAGWRAQIAEFVVSDTGRGIAPADQARIFEPFERAADGSVPGTGLGLTITRLLTEILGGEITLDSRPGEGSRFRARLMLSDVPGAATVAAPDRMGHAVGYEGPRRRILVADDDPHHRALMTDLLAPLGFELLAVGSGAECLSAVARFAPHLFLLDLSMPGMDGITLARQLRERGCDAPILFISADLAPRVEGDLADCPVLAKPVQVGELLTMIGRRLALGWQRPGPAAEGEPAQSEPAQAAPGAVVQRGPAGGGGRLTGPQAAALRALLEGGQIRRLRERLDQYEAESADLAPLVAPLRALAASYQLDALRAALDRMAV